MKRKWLTMGKYLMLYNEIITKYRNGAFGENHLTLHEILSKAGEPDLLEKMTLSEIQQLLNTSSGMTKQMFSYVKGRKIDKLEKIKQLEDEVSSLNVKKYCGNESVSAENLAKNLELEVCYCEPNDLPEDVEATLSPTEDRNYLGIIKILSDSAAVFSYMHEIIHYLRDVGAGNRVSRAFTRKKQGKTDSLEEQDINYLTAAVIMPYEQIEQDLNEYENTSLKDEEEFLDRMAIKYGQEKDAVLRRFIEVRGLVDYQMNFAN